MHSDREQLGLLNEDEDLSPADIEGYTTIDDNDAVAKRFSFLQLLKGPPIPKESHVTPIFRPLQRFPDAVRAGMSKPMYWTCTIVFLLFWSLLFLFIVTNSLLAYPSVGLVPAEPLRCGAEYSVWLGKNDACGLDGQWCGASQLIGKEFTFRCQADCQKESWTYSETPVGSYKSLYRPYVVGGNNTYRADSSICGSAIHRGVISDASGGCGRIRFLGERWMFPKEKSANGRFESIEFDSEFPASFEFIDVSDEHQQGCKDRRFPLLAVNVVLSLFFGYFYPVSSSKGGTGVFLGILSLAGFWVVILGTNPPLSGGSDLINAELISLAFRRLFPGAMCTYVIYRFATRPQLKDMDAHLSRALFWVPAFWIGIVENYTFGHLPLDRLTKHDLDSQPGAWLALGLIVGIVSAIAVGQAYIIWRAGKFIPYILYYMCVAILLLLLSFVPSQTLRLHHYIWTMILLPGTFLPTTPGLAYQGLLVGLFVAGVARWDFDSILQTYEQLRRGAPTLRDALPNFLAPQFTSTENSSIVTLHWQGMPDMIRAGLNISTKYDGFSLIVNDVERYRGNLTYFNLSEWANNTFSNLSSSVREPVNYYFRLALAHVLGYETGDYTRAAILNIKTGNWTFPEAGAI